MAGKRKITGKTPLFGNKRSHSLRATRRKWEPNLQNKRIWVPEMNQHIRVTVSVGELRTIDKIGLPEFLRRRGLTIKSIL